ncbi:lipopolysaccharide biosynthesis protein [Mucilaginibacter sp. KACC 22063]|uniref:lipopolysaccharide biosynthesis protein n=1 Tax=Mucilaginibacter sp. KACC 22063 TaxID=3025666 RepID=UPI0023665D2B|nr:hypothetical protein [Mucilaginibacter sp. KACC 22063]WDF54706.1 hypothetical protein PQ461_17380 [Mucilaginibacter sp. KACC 22063]
MIAFLKEVKGKFGVDKAIFYTILSRVLQAGGGLLSVVFITKFLTPTEQGYYYTFASILAIQIFFELGLSSIITQYAAYEFAHLKWSAEGLLNGEEYYKSRLASILKFCVKWFGVIAIVLLLVLIIVGLIFFSTYNSKGVVVNWRIPWFILCISTALNLFIDPLLAFFDGLNEIEDMAKIRLIQKSVNIFLLYLLFAMGFKLYSSPIASIAAILINYIQILATKRYKLLKTIWLSHGKDTINYLKDIFPFQWRIALSWISGYLIFQLFVPVVFATDGSVAAGRMGMTLAALSGVLSISLSWVNTKVPIFSQLISKKNYIQLDETFFKTLKQSSAVCALCLVLLISIVIVLQKLNLSVGNRFLSYPQLIMLSLASFVNQFVATLATYLRCHKKEPYLLQSVVLGILTAMSTLLLGKFYGVNGIVIGYTAIIVLISLTWSVIVFRNKRIEWHQA